MGPVRMRDVDEAQMYLVTTAKDLADREEIVIADNKEETNSSTDGWSMTVVAKRFVFDNYFDTNDKGVTVARDFTVEDLEQARREGFTEGKALGREEAQASINQQVADALANASRAFQALQQGMEGLKQEVEIDALRTVSMIVGKIVPHYATKHGLKEVEALVHDCLAAAYDEPRVVVRAHGSILGPLTDHLDQVTTSSVSTVTLLPWRTPLSIPEIAVSNGGTAGLNVTSKESGKT